MGLPRPSAPLAAAAIAGCLLGFAPRPGSASLSDPEGVWSCIAYGEPSRQSRLSLVLYPDSRAYLADQIVGGMSNWRQLGDWTQRRRELTFVDARSGRIYSADLRYDTLGGTWSSRGRSGGWWCTRRPESIETVEPGLLRATPEFFVSPLVPGVMASPRYPIAAIRQAKEGEAVACFRVEPDGSVHDAEILSITDDIFAATTLSAISRSRYRPAPAGGVDRPGCRVFSYSLELINP